MIEIIKFDEKTLRQVYVRCEYQEGLFEHEGFVRMGFNPSRMFVNKRNVLALKDGSYCIKAFEIKELRRDGQTVVWVKDSGDYKKRLREVAIDDLVNIEGAEKR